MSSILNPEGFGRKIYERYPEIFQKDDAEVKFALRRYLDSLGDGGYKYIIEGANRLLDHYDWDRVDLSILPHLFNSFGFEIFHGIPEVYMRKLLPVLSDLYKRKGTVEAVEYLASIVSGVKSTIEVIRPGTVEEALFGRGIFNRTARFGSINKDYGVIVYLELDYSVSDRDLPDKEQITRIIREFIPFYCLVTVIFQFIYTDVVNFHNKDVLLSDHIDERLTDPISFSVYEKAADKMGQYLNETARLFSGFSKELARFNEGVFGSGVFFTTSKLTVELEKYDIKEKGAETARYLGNCDTQTSYYFFTGVQEESITPTFTDSHESDKIEGGKEISHFVSEGKIPKYSAVFNGGVFGSYKFGADIPYQESDMCDDVITYLES